MEETHYKVQVAPDHVQRLCGASPARAISELLWNSLDADATRVQVTVLPGELGTAALIVRDNGHGIPHAEIKGLFVNLGGSWKANATKTKVRGRALHGKEGKGRYKAFALGRVSEWVVTYREGSEFRRYTVTVLADDLLDIRVSAAKLVEADEPGVEVRISESSMRSDALDSGELRQELPHI
jgi:Histidine kinase-, DNA gyrase B-, and HSP90-like ATPase